MSTAEHPDALERAEEQWGERFAAPMILRRLVAQVTGVQQVRRPVKLLQVCDGMAAVLL